MTNSLIIFSLISCAVTAFLYWIFYYFSPLIWSFNNSLELSQLTPLAQMFFKEGRNGGQLYVLYIAMFLVLGLVLALNHIYFRIKNNAVKGCIFLSLISIGVVFLKDLHLEPPMSMGRYPASWNDYLLILTILLVIFIFLYLNKWGRVGSIVIFLSLLLLCILSASYISKFDYNSIFGPAWRMLHGFSLRETYSRYDYFLPILASFWIKFNLPLETISFIVRFAYLILFFATYLLSKRLFFNKSLSVYLLISMVLIKLYCNTYPPDFAMQVSPLRLDLWLIILALSFWKNANNWFVGAVIGVLVIFHHGFGLIYVMSYLLFIGMLIILEILDGESNVFNIFRKYFYLYFKSLLFILIGILFYQLFLSPHEIAGLQMQKMGLGFLQILPNSFYWCMPIIFSLVFLLLVKNKKAIAPRYFETAVLLISLAIGNSMYFFGRSHENNIFNISASLLFVFFLLLDLIQFEINKDVLFKFYRRMASIFAIIFIVSLTAHYSQRILGVMFIQSINFKNGSYYYPIPLDFDFKALRSSTFSSQKVIFISMHDFFYCQKGGYDLMPHYYYSINNFMFMNEAVDFLNAKIEDGYYIVVPIDEVIFNIEIIKQLKAFNFIRTKEGLIVSNQLTGN